MTGAGDLGSAPAQDVQATYCATLVDEWVAGGVRHAVVAPGSRSTPMALAFAARPDLQLHVVHDERAAAFVALGLGLGAGPFGSTTDAASSGTAPALLLCTSGTAAANFFPAVVEAGLSAVPLIVLTADRPEELRGVGAPQTIDQLELYGRHVRWFRDPDVPIAAAADTWRPLAREALREALDGPVQLNLPFREPLVGSVRDLPRRQIDRTFAPVRRPVRDPIPQGIDVQRGVILAGGRSGVARESVAKLAATTDWPIIADPMSEMRALDGVVTTADALLRHERFADDHAPELVVRVGRPAASKVLAQWAARCPLVVQVGGPGRVDPERNVAAACSIDDLLEVGLTGAIGTTWSARWAHAERRAAAVVASALADEPELSEAGVARAVAANLPAGGVLTVASSMPIRDLEWYGGVVAAHANRGANGIDGVMSTALGRALGGQTSVLLIGDLAFVHDINALIALAGRGADLRVVVVDNDGGGIFSFLPQASQLAPDRFELLFGTPLAADVLGLAAAHGLTTATVSTRAALATQLAQPGPWVARVPSSRPSNVADHDALNAAVAQVLD